MIKNGTIILPMGYGLGLDIFPSEVDIKFVQEYPLYPLDTCLEDADLGTRYRYIVDEKGYRWIGEELWLTRKDKLDG